MNRRPVLVVVALLLLGLSQHCRRVVERTDVIGAAELAAIEAYFPKRPTDLAQFMNTVAQRSTEPTVRGVAELVGAGKKSAFAPESVQERTLFRLLGLYARLRHETEMIALLGRLVALPTHVVPGRPQYQNPAILELGQLLQAEASASGLQFRNVDNRIFEIILPGSSAADLGIYTHGDVVPALPELWKLPDGERLHPFRLRITKDRLYGRGTEDDKCSIVSALFALRVVQESGIRLHRTIRLMVETTEETGGEAMEHYKKLHALPSHNIVLDSSYPVVTAEKGYGQVSASFAKRMPPVASSDPVSASGPGSVGPAGATAAAIVEVRGGAAVNQIPETAIVRIRTKQPDRLRAKIVSRAPAFVKANPPSFQIVAEARDQEVLLLVRGVSAHSSQPEQGLNPVSRALTFLAEHAQSFDLEENAYLQAARFVRANFGIDDYGAKLGVAYRDDFMGPFTAVVTQALETATHVQVNVNLRMPRGRERDDLVNQIRGRLLDYSRDKSVPFDLEVRLEEPMIRDPERAYVRTLLDIFRGVTGRVAEPIASAGATTARQLPNGVNFGPSMPEEKYRGHTALEFKKRGNFLLDLQLFTEMILRLGQMERLD